MPTKKENKMHIVIVTAILIAVLAGTAMACSCNNPPKYNPKYPMPHQLPTGIKAPPAPKPLPPSVQKYVQEQLLKNPPKKCK